MPGRMIQIRYRMLPHSLITAKGYVLASHVALKNQTIQPDLPPIHLTFYHLPVIKLR